MLHHRATDSLRRRKRRLLVRHLGSPETKPHVAEAGVAQKFRIEASQTRSASPRLITVD